MTLLSSPKTSDPTLASRSTRRLCGLRAWVIIGALLCASVGAACLITYGPFGGRARGVVPYASAFSGEYRVVIPGAGEPIRAGDMVTILVRAGGPDSQEMTGTVPRRGDIVGPATFFHEIEGMRVGEKRVMHGWLEITVLRRQPRAS